MIKYGVEFYSLVYPKWGKIRFKISDQGKFLFIINPSLTPGKLPEDLKPGVIPKGAKLFDYSEENECIVALSLNECLKVIDFAKSQNLVETVDIIHKIQGNTKSIKFAWATGRSGEIELCNINYIKTTNTGDVQKIFVPIPFDGLREIVTIFNSYISGFVILKTLCLADIVASNEPKNKKQYSAKTYINEKDLSNWEE